MPHDINIDSHPEDSSKFVGCIVDVFLQGTLHTGICIAQNPQHLEILLPTSEVVKLNPSRIALVSKSSYAPHLEELQSFIDQLHRQIGQVEEIPQLCGQDLAEVFELTSAGSDIQRFALFHFLREHPERYYQKKGLYYTRTETEAAQYLLLKHEEQARQTYLQAVEAWLESLASITPAEPLAPALREILIHDLQLILQGEKCPDIETRLRKSLPKLSRNEAILMLRKQLGDFCPHEPILNLAGIPISFPELTDTHYPKPPETDLICAEAFCIDDSDTMDFDDAISLTPTAEGYRLGIHVSNLASDPHALQSVLKLAQDRVSSLYLPSETIPMLPQSLSEDVYSLKSGSTKAALSLYSRFDPEFRYLGSELKTDAVRIIANLSYTEADKLATSHRHTPLYSMAASLRKQRDSISEQNSSRYHYNFKYFDGKVTVKMIDTLSPSRIMVEELMIFYNSFLAGYAREQALPVLNRNVSQHLGQGNQVLNSLAYLNTQPQYHPGVGVEAYLHATSPIRRWVDMLNQAQIVAVLRQETPLFKETELQQVIPQIEKRLMLLRDTYHRSERYWCLKFIEQDLLNTPVQGLLKGVWGEFLRVEVLPWGKQVLMLSEAQPQEDFFSFVPYAIDWEVYYIRADIL